MTICIPTTSDAGASARLSPDLGRAHFFTMVDVESARAWTIPNPDRRYEPGDHGAPGTMGGVIDAVICRGAGAQALAVAEALHAFRAGTMSRVGPREAGTHDQGRRGAAQTKEER